MKLLPMNSSFDALSKVSNGAARLRISLWRVRALAVGPRQQVAAAGLVRPIFPGAPGLDRIGAVAPVGPWGDPAEQSRERFSRHRVAPLRRWCEHASRGAAAPRAGVRPLASRLSIHFRPIGPLRGLFAPRALRGACCRPAPSVSKAPNGPPDPGDQRQDAKRGDQTAVGQPEHQEKPNDSSYRSVFVLDRQLNYLSPACSPVRDASATSFTLVTGASRSGDPLSSSRPGSR